MKVKQTQHGSLTITVPVPHTRYLDNLAKKDCWLDLWDLFKHADSPMKELTESYSAYQYTRDWKNIKNIVVFHIGDGAHCRTTAMFAYLTKHNNIAIDPNVNSSLVNDWMETHNVLRFAYRRCKWEYFPFYEYKFAKALLVFTHAHVNTKSVLDHVLNCDVDVLGVYVSACCIPSQQLTLPGPTFEDWGIQSPNRTCQVYKRPKGYSDLL